MKSERDLHEKEVLQALRSAGIKEKSLFDLRTSNKRERIERALPVLAKFIHLANPSVSDCILITISNGIRSGASGLHNLLWTPVLEKFKTYPRGEFGTMVRVECGYILGQLAKEEDIPAMMELINGEYSDEEISTLFARMLELARTRELEELGCTRQRTASLDRKVRSAKMRYAVSAGDSSKHDEIFRVSCSSPLPRLLYWLSLSDAVDIEDENLDAFWESWASKLERCEGLKPRMARLFEKARGLKVSATVTDEFCYAMSKRASLFSVCLRREDAEIFEVVVKGCKLIRKMAMDSAAGIQIGR
jgi:hypothetical protein